MSVQHLVISAPPGARRERCSIAPDAARTNNTTSTYNNSNSNNNNNNNSSNNSTTTVPDVSSNNSNNNCNSNSNSNSSNNNAKTTAPDVSSSDPFETTSFTLPSSSSPSSPKTTAPTATAWDSKKKKTPLSRNSIPAGSLSVSALADSFTSPGPPSSSSSSFPSSFSSSSLSSAPSSKPTVAAAFTNSSAAAEATATATTTTTTAVATTAAAISTAQPNPLYPCNLYSDHQQQRQKQEQQQQLQQQQQQQQQHQQRQQQQQLLPRARGNNAAASSSSTTTTTTTTSSILSSALPPPPPPPPRQHHHHHHHHHQQQQQQQQQEQQLSSSSTSHQGGTGAPLSEGYNGSVSCGNLSVVSTPLLEAESMPSRGYIAGKPVSRWEADSDNIDIEYKNLDKPLQQNKCNQCLSGKKGWVIKILLILSVFFIGLILGYGVRKNVHEQVIVPALRRKYVGIQQDYDPDIRDQLQARVTHVGNFEDSLQTLTRDVRLAGVGGTNRVLIYVRDWWKTFNFDSITIKNYTVRLVYPDYVALNENHVAVRTDNDTLVFETWTNNSNIHPDLTPFNAYSHSGNVQGDLIYCNFGRHKDYTWLAKHGIQTHGAIHLIRYGKVHPSNKIKVAEENGAAGVILYPDPAQYCNGLTNVSGTWWLRGDQVPSEHVRYWLTGDPSTPDYPALQGVPRAGATSGVRPNIPVYPISYDDAHRMMRHMGGTSTDESWHGGLNVSYSAGPGFTGDWEDFKVDLNVSNSLSLRDIHNVIAILRGKYEKDHYVIVGAHIDAWGYGAVDAGTSFAVIMDLARTFSQQVTKGWRPRRTIIFALWDASKYGHVGAYEWVQEYEKQLSSGGVAYINIDSAIRGNYSFYAESNPLLYDVVYKAAQSVPCREAGQEGKSVYDVWKERGTKKDFSTTRPWINNLSGDQDHSPFMYRLGMSSLLTAFSYNMEAYPELPTYPAHNTLQDDMGYVLDIDPGYILHSSLVQILSDIVLRVSDSAVIPMNVTHYGTMMRAGLAGVQKNIDSVLGANETELLKSSIEDFTKAAEDFQKQIDAKDRNNMTEFEVLEINDKLIRLSRAFIYEGGLLHRSQYRNLLIAPHPDNLNEEVVFPGLAGNLGSDPSEERVQLSRELVILVVAVKRARDILLDDFGPNLIRDEL